MAFNLVLVIRLANVNFKLALLSAVRSSEERESTTENCIRIREKETLNLTMGLVINLITQHLQHHN